MLPTKMEKKSLTKNMRYDCIKFVSLSICFRSQNLTVLKRTGHNKFIRNGPTLSGVGGYRGHHPSHKQYRQNFIAFKI